MVAQGIGGFRSVQFDLNANSVLGGGTEDGAVFHWHGRLLQNFAMRLSGKRP
jgi:hypothetical protein